MNIGFRKEKHADRRGWRQLKLISLLGDPLALYVAVVAAALLVTISAARWRLSPPPESTVGRRLVVDANGEQTSIDVPFRGAAFLATTVGDYLFVTHRPDTILLTPSFSLNENRLLWRVFGVAMNATTIRNNGAGPDNSETLLALRPGAVFSWSFQRAALIRLGLPTIGVGAPPGRFSRFDDARAYAGVLGLDGEAERIIRAYQARMAVTSRELASDVLRPRALGLGFFGDGRMAVWIESNPATRLIEQAGARNASRRRINPPWIDAEELLRLDPDLLILREGIDGHAGPASFMADPRWRALKCVASRRVYAVPNAAGAYFQGIVEDPLFVRWLAELVQPQRLRSIMRSMMRDTYVQELGYQISDAELDQMLRIKENAGSAYYERFTAHPK